MNLSLIHMVAKTLSECDGKDWLGLYPAERDRYFRISVLLVDRLEQIEPRLKSLLDHAAASLPTAVN